MPQPERKGFTYEEVIEQYRGLVWKLAYQYWKKLPMSTKLWVDLDDLIEDAYVYVLQTVARGKFDRRRASHSTFTWCGVNNLLLNFALSQRTKKRYGWMVPIEELRFVMKVDLGVTRVEAEQALNTTYQQASVELKEEMRRWFGPGKPQYKRSEASKAVKSEFLALATKNKLTRADCQGLMGSGLWLT